MKSPVPYIEMAVEAGKRVLQYTPETEDGVSTIPNHAGCNMHAATGNGRKSIQISSAFPRLLRSAPQ